MSRTVRIVVAEPSELIRAGVVAILSRITEFRLEVHEVAEAEKLRDHLGWIKPDILIVNPSLLGVFSLQKIRKEVSRPGIKYVALQFSLLDPAVVRAYDEQISVYDDGALIREKIARMASGPKSEPQREMLSVREKEIVICVVQGLTNRQIAEKLCLSAHTVITHRRNISAKLNIHSTAGLAIYAIVNKLVELSDIKTQQE